MSFYASYEAVTGMDADSLQTFTHLLKCCAMNLRHAAFINAEGFTDLLHGFPAGVVIVDDDSISLRKVFHRCCEDTPDLTLAGEDVRIEIVSGGEFGNALVLALGGTA